MNQLMYWYYNFAVWTVSHFTSVPVQFLTRGTILYLLLRLQRALCKRLRHLIHHFVQACKSKMALTLPLKNLLYDVAVCRNSLCYATGITVLCAMLPVSQCSLCYATGITVFFVLCYRYHAIHRAQGLPHYINFIMDYVLHQWTYNDLYRMYSLAAKC
jgi:hypothetical protein